MRKSRIELLLIAVAVLALGAGVAGGLLAARLPFGAKAQVKPIDRTHAGAHGPDRTPLTDELDLSAEQREQMREIWEGVREEVRGTFDKAQDLERRRDDALVALLTDEQKSKFEKLSQQFAIEFDDLRQNRDRLFESAVERTKTLLNPQQRAKYEDILKTRGPGGPGGPRPGEGRVGLPPPPPQRNDANARKNPASGPSQ